MQGKETQYCSSALITYVLKCPYEWEQAQSMTARRRVNIKT